MIDNFSFLMTAAIFGSAAAITIIQCAANMQIKKYRNWINKRKKREILNEEKMKVSIEKSRVRKHSRN